MKKGYLKWIISCLLLATLVPAIYPALPALLYQKSEERSQADELFAEGQALLQSGQFQAALKKLEAALRIYQKSPGNRFRQARCLLAIGVVKYRLADYAGALSAYQASLPIWSEIRNQFFEVITRNNIGSVYYRLGQYQQALLFHQQAIAVLENIDEQGFFFRLG